jgi:hypothetical protein
MWNRPLEHNTSEKEDTNPATDTKDANPAPDPTTDPTIEPDEPTSAPMPPATSTK